MESSPSSGGPVRHSPGLSLRLPLIAAGLGLVAGIHAWNSPISSDGLFHLLRAGQALAQVSFDPFVVPPGGIGAPLLGVFLTQLLTAFPLDFEHILRVPGTIGLGLTTFFLFLWCERRTTFAFALAAALGLAVVPIFVTEFVRRPDAAIAAAFLVAAVFWATPPRGTAATPSRGEAAPIPRTTATPSRGIAATPPRATARSAHPNLSSACAAASFLTAPWAIVGTALWALETRAFHSRGWFIRVLPFALAVALVAFFSGALPIGSRHEIWRGLFVPPSFNEGLRGVFVLLVPFLLAKIAVAASSLPDSQRPEGAFGRIAAFALILPMAAWLVTERIDRKHRLEASATQARFAQIGGYFELKWKNIHALAAPECGALSFFSHRPITPLSQTNLDAHDAPGGILFARALAPTSKSERALFRDPRFLQGYAPLVFRRGPNLELQDAFWRRRPQPATPPTAAYLDALEEGWNAHFDENREESLRAFAAAAAAEPEGLGIAHEWAGMMSERLGKPDDAETYFAEAVRRDPATARARGALSDRALSRGDVERAETLVREALTWNETDGEVWGTLARVQGAKGDFVAAQESLERARDEAPLDARIMMNLGSVRWRLRNFAGARADWRRATQLDPRIARYLGDFEKAPEDAVAPPLLPLLALSDFTPSLLDRPIRASKGEASGGTER